MRIWIKENMTGDSNIHGEKELNLNVFVGGGGLRMVMSGFILVMGRRQHGSKDLWS